MFIRQLDPPLTEKQIKFAVSYWNSASRKRRILVLSTFGAMRMLYREATLEALAKLKPESKIAQDDLTEELANTMQVYAP